MGRPVALRSFLLVCLLFLVEVRVCACLGCLGLDAARPWGPVDTITRRVGWFSSSTTRYRRPQTFGPPSHCRSHRQHHHHHHISPHNSGRGPSSSSSNSSCTGTNRAGSRGDATGGPTPSKWGGRTSACQSYCAVYSVVGRVAGVGRWARRRAPDVGTYTT